jgi:hypothetical protein
LQSVSETPDVMGLLAQTRAALAHLRAEELEELAAKAEAMLASWESSGDSSGISPRCGAPELESRSAAIGREHRLLGDLLAATGENLRVLRHSRAPREGSSRWAL